jgi:hypothetical protein
LSAGLCWVAGSFGINYLFEQRSMRLFLINGGLSHGAVHVDRGGVGVVALRYI